MTDNRSNSIASAFDSVIEELKRSESVNGQEIKISMDSSKDLMCSCICKEFIKQWQKVYRKDGENISSFVNTISKKRIIHTASCFLLGLWLYKKSKILQEQLDAQLKDFIQYQSLGKEGSFMFAWMLTCIYHDFGYTFEEGNEDFTNNIKESLSLLIRDQSNDRYIPKFAMDYMEKYREYRQCRFSRKDHGIYGGMKLMQDLHNHTDFLDYYRLAAQTIACHNMFYCVKGDEYEKCYKTKEMSKLIRESGDDKKRDYIEHPFLFLLSLVDNIEPTKFFDNFSSISAIQIELNKEIDKVETLTIIIPENVHATEEEGLEKYKDSLSGIHNWLTDVLIEGSKYEINLQIQH